MGDSDEACLKAQGVWDAVTSVNIDEKKDQMALAAIFHPSNCSEHGKVSFEEQGNTREVLGRGHEYCSVYS